MRLFVFIVAVLLGFLFARRSPDVVEDGSIVNSSRGDRERGSVLDSSTVQPVLPKRLARKQVLQAIMPHYSRMIDCGYLEPEIREVTVRFIINGNGTVSESEATGPYASTAIGDCIALKMYEIRFPQFSGPSFPVNFPFVF